MSSAAFYTVVLSAAASLMGLLSFAVLFNVDRGGHGLGASWLALATSTLNVYVMLILFPFAVLVPDLSNQTRAVVILVLAVYSVIRQCVCWGAAWKMKCDASRHVALRIAWLLLVPITAYGVLGYVASALFSGQGHFRHDLASLALMVLFIAALRNSWNLVLEHAGLMLPEEGPSGESSWEPSGGS